MESGIDISFPCHCAMAWRGKRAMVDVLYGLCDVTKTTVSVCLNAPPWELVARRPSPLACHREIFMRRFPVKPDLQQRLLRAGGWRERR